MQAFLVLTGNGRLFYDGSTFSGTPIKTITSDYVSDLRLYLNGSFSPISFSVGFGKRLWFNNLIISYRRKTEYQFIPIKIRYTSGSLYYTLEYDLWSKGLNISYMSDVGGGRSDVQLPQNSGTGYGLEFGYIFSPTTNAFINLHKWDIEASDTAFDGVSNLVEPKNNTLTATVGIGLGF